MRTDHQSSSLPAAFARRHRAVHGRWRGRHHEARRTWASTTESSGRPCSGSTWLQSRSQRKPCCCSCARRRTSDPCGQPEQESRRTVPRTDQRDAQLQPRLETRYAPCHRRAARRMENSRPISSSRFRIDERIRLAQDRTEATRPGVDAYEAQARTQDAPEQLDALISGDRQTTTSHDRPRRSQQYGSSARCSSPSPPAC